MENSLFKIKSLLIMFLFLICACKAADENSISQENGTNKTIVEHYGNIHVNGNRIVGKNDSSVALHGMSLFWSQWGGSFYNENCIRWLRDDWKCTVIRAACGVEMGGYLDNPQTEMVKTVTIIDACIKLGIYVIVDWHDHNAQRHLEQSKSFFKEIAQKYGDKPNIIYEIYNEPLQVSWSDSIKPYIQEVISVIRQYDQDNLIIAGTPAWSQDVDVAATNPVSDVNLAYTLHFYTSTHKQYLRDKAISALDKMLPLFVTEFGISEANGDGIIDYNETRTWFSFIHSNKLSTCNWSVINKDETSAALKPGTNPNGNWTAADLTESGTYIREYIRSLNSEVFESIK